MNYAELISQMTLEEKVSLLSGKDFWQTKSIERLEIPHIYLADGPHGLRKQAKSADHLGLNPGVPATCFPTAAAVANSWDSKLTEKIGVAIGKEAVSHNVNVLLGPGMNIKRDPLCGRNFEYFSEDPYLTGKLAAGYIKGIQSHGIAACPKHFAVNNQELLRMTSDSVVDNRTLNEIYLTGFEIAVKEAQPKSIMSAYNKVNGIYANENKKLLRDILVDKWGFKGIVVSDWGGSNDHVAGVKAGSHLEMPTTGGDSDLQLIEAVKNGEISSTLLDQRIEEYLKVVYDIQINKSVEELKIDIKAHHNLAREAAEASIVLLQNENGVLPLNGDSKVALIGDFAQVPRYQGAGSSKVNPTIIENTLDCINDTDLNIIGYQQGFNRNGSKCDIKIKDACLLAKKAEVVLLYIGLDEDSETEGIDRDHIKIPQNQIDLLNAIYDINQNIVVILSSGSVVEMPWSSKCKSVVHGYLSGQAGASAMLNVLAGKSCPSGKLSETYPLRYEDAPTHNYYPGKEKTSEYREGIFVGYRYYDTVNIKVKFPFGHGLSYTSFEYSNLTTTNNKTIFTIKNIGTVAGSEIAQLYVGSTSTEIFRAQKELKGFVKIHLEPGESKTIDIDFDDKTFRYFNIENNQYEVEKGRYNVMIGASSDDIRLEGEIDIDGDTTSSPYKRSLLESYYNSNVTNVSDIEFELLLGRSIPDTEWDRSLSLKMNDSFSQMFYAKSFLARLAHKLLRHLKDKSIKKGEPDLNILFIYYMPFRAIAKMTGGTVSIAMVEGLLKIINGNFFKGFNLFIKSWYEQKKRHKSMNK